MKRAWYLISSALEYSIIERFRVKYYKALYKYCILLLLYWKSVPDGGWIQV